MLRHRWHRVQVVWPNGPRHSPSANHYLADQPPCTESQYSHQVRLWGEELLLTPASIKSPPLAVKAPRTVGDLQLEGGEMVADPSVAPEGCRRRLVCSCCVRRAIFPPGQCQVFHHQQHLKEPQLSRKVGQRHPTAIPCNQQQNFTAWGGRRTLSMSSESTTNTTLPPLRWQSG